MAETEGERLVDGFWGEEDVFDEPRKAIEAALAKGLVADFKWTVTEKKG